MHFHKKKITCRNVDQLILSTFNARVKYFFLMKKSFYTKLYVMKNLPTLNCHFFAQSKTNFFYLKTVEFCTLPRTETYKTKFLKQKKFCVLKWRDYV